MQLRRLLRPRAAGGPGVERDPRRGFRTRPEDRREASIQRRPISRGTFSLTFDTTPFVRASIKEVAKTLGEATLLVFLVMYLFLQNFRATLIPTIAVPVVLLGTFAVLAVLGFSINMLTMFAMVLAIGLLVDDAIVVVENIERNMRLGYSPREAAHRTMDEVGSAVVSIALVLTAIIHLFEFMRARKAPPSGPKKDPVDRMSYMVVGGVSIWTFLFFYLFEALGYIVAGSIYLVVLMSIFNKGRWLMNSVTAVGYAIGSYLLFTKGLGVNLASGILPF